MVVCSSRAFFLTAAGKGLLLWEEFFSSRSSVSSYKSLLFFTAKAPEPTQSRWRYALERRNRTTGAILGPVSQRS